MHCIYFEFHTLEPVCVSAAPLFLKEDVYLFGLETLRDSEYAPGHKI